MDIIDRLFRLLRTLWYVPLHMLLARLAYRARCVYYASPFYRLKEVWEEPTSEQLAWKVVPPRLWEGNVEAGNKLAEGKFAFVGNELSLGVPPRTWQPVNASALWVFHLHYHEWLADLFAAGDKENARLLIADWMDGYTAWDKVVWHPYPLSLRVVNWLTYGPWLLEGEGLPDGFATDFAAVLRAQVRHLHGNVEHWLGGNHVVKNLKALVYAGVCMPGQEGVLLEGLSGLLKALDRQVHDDGGHFEASPWYHAQVLADVVEVAALLRKAGGTPPQLSEIMEKMATVLATYRHPDGGLALLNDGAIGDAAYLDKLVKRAGGGVVKSLALPQTGYVRMQRGQSVVLFDAGRVGPDENPGHAHADMLSFEASFKGERVLINSGTYAYQDARRNLLRGTAAHNTVTIDNIDSAEVWGGFRVGRRPRNVGFEAKNLMEGDVAVHGWHDGYRHLGVRHERKMVLAVDGSALRGEDILTFNRRRRGRVLAHFHLAPGTTCRLEKEDLATLETAGGLKLSFTVKGGRLDVRGGKYAPHFGVMEEAQVLVVHGGRKGQDVKLGWMLKVKN